MPKLHTAHLEKHDFCYISEKKETMTWFIAFSIAVGIINVLFISYFSLLNVDAVFLQKYLKFDIKLFKIRF